MSRRGVAAFGVFLAGVVGGAAITAQSGADALSTGYGGAKFSCILIPYSYPQYGIAGVVRYCGSSYHAPGWR